MENNSHCRNQSRVNILIDAGILVLIVVLTAPKAIGENVHEWLGLFFSIAFLIHLLLHWKWLASVTARFFKRLPGRVRFNYLWNSAFFALLVTVTFSGLLISRAVLPSLGVPIQGDRFWKEIHEVSADLLLVFLGIHLGMHWTWIIATISRLFPGRRAGLVDSQGIK